MISKNLIRKVSFTDIELVTAFPFVVEWEKRGYVWFEHSSVKWNELGSIVDSIKVKYPYNPFPQIQEDEFIFVPVEFLK